MRRRVPWVRVRVRVGPSSVLGHTHDARFRLFHPSLAFDIVRDDLRGELDDAVVLATLARGLRIQKYQLQGSPESLRQLRLVGFGGWGLCVWVWVCGSVWGRLWVRGRRVRGRGRGGTPAPVGYRDRRGHI